MLQPQVEQILAWHCAPTLLGAKASNLVALPAGHVECPGELARSCNQELGGGGLVFTLLCSCRKNALMLVYRPALLQQKLENPEAQNILRYYGYPVGKGLQPMLRKLRERLEELDGFPHEIGLFLDYPPEDVEGFIRNRGADCKMCGYWKVYSDVAQAKARFACYDACRKCLCGLVESGNTISGLVKPA